MFQTLKGKISSIYFLLVLLIAVVGFISVINLHQVSGTINALMTDNYKSISAIDNMLEAIELQDSAILTYINIDRQKGIELFSENSAAFLKWYNIEANNITEVGEKEYVSQIYEYYNKYLKSFSELQETINVSGVQKSIQLYYNSIEPNFTFLKEQMKKLISFNEKAMFQSKDEATDYADKSMYFVLILSVSAVIIGFFLSRFFTNRFLKPIYTLTKAITLVGAGALNRQISINSKDEIGHLATEFNNMTNRLQQYEQSTLGTLLAEKNKSLAIVKSISDPLIVLDKNYKIMLLNNAFEVFFEIKEEAVVNKHFLEAVSNDELFEHISSGLDSQEDYREKIMHIKTKDDYFNVVVSTVKNAEAIVTGLIVVFQDVTKLKKLEKVKTDFVATVSHEFKTPLTSIIMGTSMLLDGSLGTLNENQNDVVKTIREDEEKLSALVHELLELSKIESDKAIFNIRKCSMENIIVGSIKQYFEQSKEKGISLIYEITDNLPAIEADPEKITWVLNNLIANALKYTNKGDSISVHAGIAEDKVRVSVSDTGIGIPPEFVNKIFGKFVQVQGYDREVRGNGLGLAIVKEIITAHGGEIWCTSKLDEGSVFTFTLPIHREDNFDEYNGGR